MPWIGTKPDRCEICRQPLKDFFYDGRVFTGAWAIMCQGCFVLFGVGLGLGKGQKYDNHTGQKLDG
jgi:hypothetical protein